MSERYVWERYDIKFAYRSKASSVSKISGTTTRDLASNPPIYFFGVPASFGSMGGQSITEYVDQYIDQATGRFVVDRLIGYGWRENVNISSTSAYPTQYFMVILAGDSAAGGQSFAELYYCPQRPTGEVRYTFYVSGYGTRSYEVSLGVGNKNDPDSTSGNISFQKLTTESYKTHGDDPLDNVSSSSKTYPDDGIGTTASTKSKWYVFKGTDNIDPVSITYPTPSAGEPLAVTVQPGNGKRYGGNVFYEFWYAVNGESTWKKAGKKTKDTTIEIDIPEEGVNQIQVRVVASDDLGFTSSTYVTGELADVQHIHAYVGVNGVARAVTAVYVGANGVARKVVRGYVGVNGIARRWM